MGRKRIEWRIDWECTTTKLPPHVKKFLVEVIGKKETKKLMQAMRVHSFIMLVGPEHSGKSAILEVLRRIGYPWVIDDNGFGRIIKTSNPNVDQKVYRDIFAELENAERQRTEDKDCSQN